MTVARIQLRQDTSAGWAAANPVLAKGELGFDTTVNRVKAGDGANAWSALSWSTMSSAEIQRVMAAADAIEQAGTPTDAVVAAQIGTPTSATRQALSATIDAVAGVGLQPVRPALGGADVTGEQDAAATIQSGLTAANSGPKAVELDPGVFRIVGTGDVEWDRSVQLRGSGPQATRLDTFEAGPNRTLKVKGETSLLGNWIALIERMSLNRIGILGGETTDDWAHNLTIRDVDIMFATAAIRARFHSWLWRLYNVNVHHCGTGLLFDFGPVRDEQNANVANGVPPGTGSGANMMVFGGTFQDCSSAAFHQNRNALDGSSTTFFGTNFEHSAVAILVTGLDGGMNVIRAVDGCHFELGSQAYVRADSGVIEVESPWMGSLQGSSKVAFFDLSGTARASLSGGRVHWDAATGNYLAKLSGSADLVIDPHSVVMPPAWAIITPDAYPGSPIHPESTKGFRVKPGPLGGKLSLSQALSTANYTVASIPPGDATHYEFEFEVEVTAAGTDNSYAIVLDPAAFATFTLALPAGVTGHAVVKVRTNRSATRIQWTYSNGASGRAVVPHPGLALTSRVALNVRKSATNNSTANLRSPMVTALASNA